MEYPPETNIAPENGWLEDDRFLLGPSLFSGAFAVSLREGTVYPLPFFPHLGVDVFPPFPRSVGYL